MATRAKKNQSPLSIVSGVSGSNSPATNLLSADVLTKGAPPRKIEFPSLGGHIYFVEPSAKVIMDSVQEIRQGNGGMEDKLKLVNVLMVHCVVDQNRTPIFKDYTPESLADSISISVFNTIGNVILEVLGENTDRVDSQVKG